MKKLLLIITTSISLAAISQPANNLCPDNVALPTDGSCLNGETTASATDGWFGSVGCQPGGGGNEVWYSFTATETQIDISITQGTMTGDVDIILVRDENGPCGDLTIAGSYCGPASGSLTETTNPGQDYLVTINSEGSDGTFDICATATSPPPVPGTDCSAAASLCDGNSFSQGVFTGIGTAEETTDVSCFSLADERQAKWYTFTADESGTFEMFIDAVTAGDDYDFILINSTSSCYQSGLTIQNPIACDYSGCADSETGLSSDPAGTWGVTDGMGLCAGFPAWNAPPTLTAGETYSLLIDNFTASGTGFTANFGGTADMGPDAEFAFSLAANCFDVTFDRLTNYTGANMTYSWNFGDGNTSTSAVPTHTYGGSGLYTTTLTVTDANGCTNTFSQVVNAGCVSLSLNPINLKVSKRNSNENVLLWKSKGYEEGYFEIERANSKKKDFKTIGKINVNNEQHSFSFTDKNSFDGKSYYRIKAINSEGKSRYSSIEEVTNDETKSFSIYPNPIQDGEFTISTSLNDIDLDVILYDISGKKVVSKYFSKEEKKSIQTNNISKGLYFIRIHDNSGNLLYSEKLINK